MKLSFLRHAALSIALLCAAPATFAQTETGNKALVLKAVSELFIQRDATALDRYWDADYVQHNPRMPNGIAFLRRLIASIKPEARYEPGLVLESGEFVAVHGRYTGWTERPLIAMDLFRVRNGKLVEHWDVIQEEVPADKTPSGNTMFPVR